MGKFIDMTGWRMSEHGVPNSRLTVIERAEDTFSPKGSRITNWKCKCDCGKIKVIQGTALRKGVVLSCGCYHLELLLASVKSRKMVNKYVDKGDYLEGYDGKGNCFLIDKDDYNKVKDYRWNMDNHGYWCYSTSSKENGRTRIKMHKLICPSPSKDLVVDHYNRNRSDNRKNNLFLKTPRENGINKEIPSNNTSGFIGVSQRKDGYWVVRINTDVDKTRMISSFATKEEALICRLNFEKLYYKENAPQRHLFEEYNITEEGAKEYCNQIFKRIDNTSGTMGVFKRENKDTWRVEIRVKNERKNFGSFTNKEEAIRVRLLMEKYYYGDNALQKNLFDKYNITLEEAIKFHDDFYKKKEIEKEKKKDKITGVSYSEKIKKWEVYICVNRKNIYLGAYKDKNDAIIARLKGEIKYRGKDNAPQKHLFKQYGIE